MKKAHVEWDGYYWVAALEGGGTTQAKRLAQIPRNLVEVAKVMTGETVSPADFELDVDYGDGLGRRALALRRERARVEKEVEQVKVDTLATVAALRSKGMSLRDISELTGISYQRVQQLTKQKTRSSSTGRPVSGTAKPRRYGAAAAKKGASLSFHRRAGRP